MAKPQVSVRRPPPAAPPTAEADAFIRGASGAEPSSAPPAGAKRAPPGSRVQIERQGGRVRRRMTIYFAPDTAEALTAWCEANGGQEISRVVDRLVAEGLRRKR